MSERFDRQIARTTLRGTSGEWLTVLTVQVEASLMLLDQHTTAALVTLNSADVR